MWPHLSTRTSAPGIMKFTFLVDPPWSSLLSLSESYLGVEKKIFKEIMHCHYMPDMVTP